MFPLVTGRGREESELWLGSWWLQGWGLLLWDRCSWSGFWYFCLLVQTCFFTRVTHSTSSRGRCTRKALSLSRWQIYTKKLVMMIYIYMVMSTKSAIKTKRWWTEQWTYPKDFFKQRKRWMQGIYMVCRLFFFRICSRIFLVWSTARENIDQSEDVRSFQIKAHSDEIQVHPLNFSGWAPATATLLPSSSTSWK